MPFGRRQEAAGIIQGAGERFVHEQRYARLDEGPGPLPMDCTIVGGNQDGINLSQQVGWLVHQRAHRNGAAAH